MGFGGGSSDNNEPTYRKVTVKGDTQRPDPINKAATRVTREQNPSLLSTDESKARTG